MIAKEACQSQKVVIIYLHYQPQSYVLSSAKYQMELVTRGSYMNLIFFFFEGNFFTSSYQGCRCRFNFAQQQTQWISGKHCFLPHKFDSLLLVLCTDGFALTLYQVIDHTRSGETLVIGLVLRRYVISFVHQLQKELFLQI